MFLDSGFRRNDDSWVPDRELLNSGTKIIVSSVLFPPSAVSFFGVAATLETELPEIRGSWLPKAPDSVSL